MIFLILLILALFFFGLLSEAVEVLETIVVLILGGILICPLIVVKVLETIVVLILGGILICTLIVAGFINKPFAKLIGRVYKSDFDSALALTLKKLSRDFNNLVKLLINREQKPNSESDEDCNNVKDEDDMSIGDILSYYQVGDYIQHWENGELKTSIVLNESETFDVDLNDGGELLTDYYTNENQFFMDIETESTSETPQSQIHIISGDESTPLQTDPYKERAEIMSELAESDDEERNFILIDKLDKVEAELADLGDQDYIDDY